LVYIITYRLAQADNQ